MACSKSTITGGAGRQADSKSGIPLGWLITPSFFSFFGWFACLADYLKTLYIFCREKEMMMTVMIWCVVLRWWLVVRVKWTLWQERKNRNLFIFILLIIWLLLALLTFTLVYSTWRFFFLFFCRRIRPQKCEMEWYGIMVYSEVSCYHDHSAWWSWSSYYRHSHHHHFSLPLQPSKSIDVLK